ncbi:hypothetical protein ABFS82_05G121500 [Erythranthe guttata]
MACRDCLMFQEMLNHCLVSLPAYSQLVRFSTGLAESAAALQKVSATSVHFFHVQQIQWPSQRAPCGLFLDKFKHSSCGHKKIKIKLKDSSERYLLASENAQEPPLSSTSVLPMKSKLKETVELSPSERRLNSNYDFTPEKITLHSLVIQYSKQEHHQRSVPVMTLPPLLLLHPNVCPEPNRSPILDLM